ncbi:riboflavin kinase / FMN adenylyltransferase [Patescibacteria group bacterium]|nr:riboflavin kinase / FMN adenylyltransferase [Patescibacteria group bacterium]
MRLIRGLYHLEPFYQGCVLTIGNFDGLHLGHQAVIKKLAGRGKALDLPIVAMTFEPQPLEYFLHQNAPSRLTRLREKVIEFSKQPVDHLIIVKFNQEFADYDAEQFIKDILLDKLHVKHLVIGDDFHFGKARRGNFALLKEQGAKHGFTVEDTNSYYVHGLRVSSTLIRDALNIGDVKLAADFLGHDYAICGRVVHGDKRGRVLGFPTANIQLFRKNTPISGVFAVTMTGVDNLELQGIANVGSRPTFDGSSKVILEVHLFNFQQEIYGHYVEVHFKQKIRDEQQFASLEELKTQIETDIVAAKQFFNEAKSC